MSNDADFAACSDLVEFQVHLQVLLHLERSIEEGGVSLDSQRELVVDLLQKLMIRIVQVEGLLIDFVVFEARVSFLHHVEVRNDVHLPGRLSTITVIK